MRVHENIERTCWALLLGVVMSISAEAKAAGIDMHDGQWRFTVSPYGWLPDINGKLRFNVPPGQGGSPEINADPGGYLSHLQFVAMISGEARKGPLAFSMDLIYLNMGDIDSRVRTVHGPLGNVSIPVDAAVNTDLKALIWQGAASYTVVRNTSASLDVLGGVRYAGIESELSWDLSGPGGVLGRNGSLREKVKLWNGIVGIKGSVALGPEGRWFMPYYVDVGWGDDSRSWQAYAGVGYRFGWGDLIVAYRHLQYDQSGGALVQDLTLGGPLIGASFRW